MIRTIRTGKFSRFLAIFLCLTLLNSIFSPQVFALTSGPTLPEVQSFEPVETNQMVDVFSGDFVYNIPLFDLPGPNGGYPFNLAYHSGIGMDQEATWIGLGWTLNPGAVVRNVRGLPDDFNGDIINQEFRMKSNETYGLDFGANIEIFGGDLGLGLNLKFYYNNYKGIGYGFGFDATVSTSETSGIGLGINTDSQGGAGINAQLSLKAEKKVNEKDYAGNLSLGLTLHSQEGLSMRLSGSYGKAYDTGKKTKSGKEIYEQSSIGGSTGISFASQSYPPAVEHEMSGLNLYGNIKIGGSIIGVFGNLEIGIFYNTEFVKNNVKDVPAYGYMYLQEPFKNGKKSANASGKDYMLDYNREKDGLITNSSPNLAIPFLTYDYYNVEGQGLSGTVRPFRSDIGHIHDQFITSKTNGGSLGLEFPLKHFGGSGSYTNTITETSDWAMTDKSGNSYGYNFDSNDVFFKMHGELSAVDTTEMNFIGNNSAVYIPVKKNKNIMDESFKLSDSQGKEIKGIGNTRPSSDRARLGSEITTLTNTQMSSGEYSVQYYNTLNYKSGGKVALDRSLRNNKKINNQIGALSILNPEGQRYVYALPAYNLEQREYLYSVNAEEIGNPCATEFPLSGDQINYHVDGTDEYYKKTETPPYAHSYLLTSILGADYVDLTNNGPSDDDLGYWVKFNYVKLNDYGWRAPYKNANYDPGMISFKSDDKASFIYGKKEIWHLATVETKTHIAEFVISERNDGKGASEMNRTGNINFNGSSYKLDQVKIYLKKDYNENPSPVPLKTVHFEYSYELCPNVENNSVANQGKLTLKRLWFTYQNDNSGELNAYQFDYTANYPYDLNKYDRWGNYKGNGSECDRRNEPYVVQTDYPERDAYASAWQLSSITLPSGGTIAINYESDDYAYVQHKPATQMIEIASLNTSSEGSKIFDGWNKSSMNGNKQQRRIYFNLEHPISAPSQEEADEVFKKKYIDGLARRQGVDMIYQLYFKAKIKLRGTISEYVSGYADLDLTDNGEKLYGVSDPNEQGYTKGYITVKSYKVDRNKDKFYHPFAAAAWQYIRTNKPELLVAPGSIDAAPATSKMDKAMKAKSLLSVFNSIRDIFKDYTSTAYDKHWGDEIELGQAWIRLCSPDKKKYGGGSRVKQISINDKWNEQTANIENSAAYGQVYDYTMEENGETISSGVATYEPMIGGDENPLRYAKKYSNNVPFKSPNQLYFEYPIDESLYPGPSVGYRKVSVRSLVAAVVKDDPENYKRASGGVTVYEFYTCKEFPVITKETEIKKYPYNLYIPIPLIGSLEWHNLTASQGYAIELNDMHGKPKSIKNYNIGSNGDISQLVSGVEYYYKQKNCILDGEWVSEATNSADVLQSFTPEGAQIVKRDLGTEYDFFTDTRHNKSRAWQGGVNINVDLLILGVFPCPIPVPWPIVSRSDRELRTVVANKVIFKPGILEKIVQTDGASVVTTKHLLFDERTGRPLLTTVTNNYNAPVYNLSVPAYKIFNSNLEQTRPVHIQAIFNNVYNLYSDFPLDFLHIGDHVALSWNDGNSSFSASAEVIIINAGNYLISSTTQLPAGQTLGLQSAELIGRIALNADAIAISALDNPTQNFLSQTDNSTIKVPDVNGNIVNRNISTNIYLLNNVLNINCVSYSNLWDRNSAATNSFGIGCRSMWIPNKTFVINTDRSQSSGINLATDGVMNNVPLMDLLNPVYISIKPEWKLPEEITRISPHGKPQETKDILGHYSTALYGYSGGEVTVTAGNTEFDEVGYQGFDDILSNTYGTPTSFSFQTDNLTFCSSGVSKLAIKQYNVIIGNGKASVIDMPYDGSNTFSEGKICAFLESSSTRDAENVIQLCKNISLLPAQDVYLGKTTMLLNDADLSIFANNRLWNGKIIVPENIQIQATSSKVERNGHTGKYALTSNGDEHLQRLIKLKPQKEYILDFWMKSSAFSNSQINFYDGQDNQIQNLAITVAHKVGKQLENWQKMQITFTVPLNTKYIGLKFPQNTYIDDIRIFPSNGSIKTYVYNTDNLRLSAVLDENNYATFYYYDEQGDLFLIKKETEDGIKTIQESRSHLPER